MAELGKAYITVIPSMRKEGGQSLVSELGGITKDAGGKSGKGFAAGFGKGAVKAMGAVGIAASIGSVFTKGFSRMTAIDNAKAKLTALGNSTKTVEQISKNANAAVKGTAYGMDAAMTAAASATAAGIKPGKELTRYLTLMGDAAAVAGVDMGEMGSIFNKVAANGKVTTEEMNQLADRGIPIWQLLAKETGKSMDDLRTSIQKGEIDVGSFQNAIEAGMGGAAKTIGSKTITGAISNINASISRMGANLLGSSDDANSFAGKLLPLMNNLMGFMGKIESGASVLGQVIGSIIGPIMEGLGMVFTELGNGTSEMAPLKTILIQIGQTIGTLISTVMPLVVPAIRLIMTVLGVLIGRLNRVWSVVRKGIPVLKGIVRIVSAVASGVIKTVNLLVKFVTGKLSFAGLVAKVRGVWNRVKNAIMKPIESAKSKVSGVVNRIKGLFPLSIGKIFTGLKIPSITVTGGKAPFGIAGKGSLPKFHVNWNAEGGIFDRPTILQGLGEAGPEAAIPLTQFWKRMDNIANAINDNGRRGGTVYLVMNVDGKVIGKTAVDYVNEQTVTFGVNPVMV